MTTAGTSTRGNNRPVVQDTVTDSPDICQWPTVMSSVMSHVPGPKSWTWTHLKDNSWHKLSAPAWEEIAFQWRGTRAVTYCPTFASDFHLSASWALVYTFVFTGKRLRAHTLKEDVEHDIDYPGIKRCTDPIHRPQAANLKVSGDRLALHLELLRLHLFHVANICTWTRRSVQSASSWFVSSACRHERK